jgi:hypothetical protein
MATKILACETPLRRGFRISGGTRSDWANLTIVQWFRPDLRDSVPPILHLPNGSSTISPVRMHLNVLAGYDELDARDWNLWRQGFWCDQQYEAALEANKVGREQTRKRLLSAYAWEAERRKRGQQ